MLGLQGSLVGIISKSAVIRQVTSDEGVPSNHGDTRRLNLHSDSCESHTYSVRLISSFCKRYVGDCHSICIVTRAGSIVVSRTGFLMSTMCVTTREESDF